MPYRNYNDLIPYYDDYDDLSDYWSSPFHQPRRFCKHSRYYPHEIHRRRPRRDEGPAAIRKTLEELTEPALARAGDLGWNLEYATAYCYQHLVGNRPCIVDTIDTARHAPLDRSGPFLLFDSLDQCLFRGKLKGMVFLKWRSLSDNSPGVTRVPGIKNPRISIELNTRPFDERGADLDDMLDALIHQMIHAYFLVCCGTPLKDGQSDGRLLDALHFGVILSTIKEISEDCEEGPLGLTFYAHLRGGQSRGSGGYSSYRRALLDYHDSRSDAKPYIAIDPKGNTVGLPPDDGQTHCMHDNRRFRPADIRNWQVTNYRNAIELDMDKKGRTIYDLDVSGKLLPVDRLHGPASSTYVELVWDDKRVMAPREKVVEFDSLKKPLQREGKYELHMPKCDFHTLKCVWDFIQHSKYSPQHAHLGLAASLRHQNMKGPPIIVHGSAFDTTDGVAIHIRVFKVAEGMKFTELQSYAMERLYEMPTAADDPITALKEIYNENDKDKDKPIHAELHKWARKFLARTDEPPHHHRRHTLARRDPWYSEWHHHARGTSNYEKLVAIHGERFQALYHRNAALKDDSKLVVAQLSYPSHLLSDETEPALALPPLDTTGDSRVHHPSYPSTSLAPHLPAAEPIRRRRSFSDFHDPLDWRFEPSNRALSRERARLLDAPAYEYEFERFGRRVPRALLEDERREFGGRRVPFYDYFSRSDGRRRRVDALTGERFARSRERWRDLYGLG